MRHCYNCHRMTAGEPLFCNYCGRSYDTKLCPRLHPNPRTAEVCSQCGSRDLSVPQPSAPWWGLLLLWLVSFLPGILLLLFSLAVVISFVQALVANPELFQQLMSRMVILVLMLGLLWWMYSQLPAFLRRAFGRGWQRLMRKQKNRE
jgi:RNA polymerase subunit RPABC4/transcription elongation factor Spt4